MSALRSTSSTVALIYFIHHRSNILFGWTADVQSPRLTLPSIKQTRSRYYQRIQINNSWDYITHADLHLCRDLHCQPLNPKQASRTKIRKLAFQAKKSCYTRPHNSYLHGKMTSQQINERLAVCSWSLQPTTPQDLVTKVQSTGIQQVQLDLDPLRESPTV